MTTQKPRSIRVITGILVVTAALTYAGFTARRHSAAKRAAAPTLSPTDRGIAVAVAVAERRTFPTTISASGFLEPFEQLTVSAEVPGRIQHQYVEVADEVAKDAPLFQLDDSTFRVSLEKAKAAADRAASEQKLAREQVKRFERIQEQDSANPIEIIKVNTDLAVADAVRKQADAAVEEARILLAETTLRAPITGRIARIFARQGEYAYAGQPLADIIEEGRLKITVQLNDREVVAFQRGDPVTMTSPALPAKAFTGSILRIHPRATLDSRKFEVEIEVPNTSHALRPGFYVKTELKHQDADHTHDEVALVIPRLAVFELYRQQFCYVVRQADDESAPRAHRTPIETSPVLSDMQWVRVFSGVEPGDRVVTTGLLHVKDRSVVRIVGDQP